MRSENRVVLSKRLQVIADNIEEYSVVADIGCDHAFLSIAIAQEKNPKMVYACDINEKPLQSAKANIKKNGVQDKVKTVLSNGFDSLKTPEKINTVVIAGMGGELIADIIGRATWLQDNHITLFLQPMTTHDKLREFLSNAQFKIEKEIPVVENGKIYTVIQARFTSQNVKKGALFYYLGEIAGQRSKEAEAYKISVFNKLKNKLKGLQKAKTAVGTEELEQLIAEVQATFKK